MDVMGIRMDKIQQCAQNFLKLVSTTKYVFHVAKRGVKVLTLDFDLKDFHHLVGLQYLLFSTLNDASFFTLNDANAA